MKHCLETELAMYSGNALNFFARRRVRLHLAVCARCRMRLHRLADDDSLLRELRQARSDFERAAHDAPEDLAALLRGRPGDSVEP